MPKLKAEDVAIREKFAFEVFKKDPGLSVAKANALVKAKFGSNIRAAKMYDLRRLAGLESGGTPPAPLTQAGRPSKKARPLTQAARQPGEAVTQALPMLVRLESLTPAQAVAFTLDELRMAGLTNLKVEDVKDRYIIVDVAQ